MKEKGYPDKNFILTILKGMVVGTGAILPGVSGGVLCVAFGIYEPLIEVLSDPKNNLKKHLSLFLPFGIGWLSGFFLLAKVLQYVFLRYETLATVLFAGLIIGTLPSLLKDVKKETKSYLMLAIWTALFTALFIALESGRSFDIQANVFWYAVSGAIWGLSMIVPGLSSSSLLIVMGLYQKMTAGIASFDLTVILPLLAGLLATVLSLSKLVKHLYDHYRESISLFIAGVMIASVIGMLLKLTYQTDLIPAYLALFIAGYFVAGRLDG